MRQSSLTSRLAVAVIGLSVGTEFVEAVNTISILKSNDAHRQAYDDTVAQYEEDKLAFEMEIQKRLEYVESSREFEETMEKTREETEAILSAENGVKITIATTKPKPLETDYDIKIPVEPDAPATYVVPAPPEARADFLKPGHELGKFIHQWSKDLT